MEHVRIHGSLHREPPRKSARRRRRSELPRTAPLAPERGWTRAAWTRCVDSETLIDLREWLEATRCESVPETIATDYGFTTALWTFIESAPFAEIGPTLVEDRVLRIHRAATRSLYWALSPSLRVPAAPGGWIPFVAKVRSRSCDGPWSMFRLHVERSTAGSVFLTVGLASELQGHPAALAFA